ncbi:MAG: serine/threonine protein kinase, partial [Candidatus Melainabacteria bacterium]|nr:serine/threonine protein kinase [Candidatus Melainabacteria bacterium]
MKSNNSSPDADKNANPLQHRLAPGTWVGDCEVLGFLSEGGMGEVYKVRHKYLNKTLALKLLPLSDRRATERFRNEARALARLSHDNIVSIYDFFTDETLGLPCLTMEFIQGESIADAVSRGGPMPEERVAKIFLQLFDALSYAHERRIIHRDIKPSNLILSLDSRGREKVHILDFGIAKFTSPAKNMDNSITGSGEIVGSPVYMSPEQCRGEKVSESSDLYSAGCCLFYCLTGKPPLKGPNALATIAAKLEGKTESLASHQERLGISTSLVELTDLLIQREPGNRIKSAAEAAHRLGRIVSPAKPAAPAWGPDKKERGGKVTLVVLLL